jgi:hypothetical protein
MEPHCAVFLNLACNAYPQRYQSSHTHTQKIVIHVFKWCTLECKCVSSYWQIQRERRHWPLVYNMKPGECTCSSTARVSPGLALHSAQRRVQRSPSSPEGSLQIRTLHPSTHVGHHHHHPQKSRVWHSPQAMLAHSASSSTSIVSSRCAGNHGWFVRKSNASGYLQAQIHYQSACARSPVDFEYEFM